MLYLNTIDNVVHIIKNHLWGQDLMLANIIKSRFFSYASTCLFHNTHTIWTSLICLPIPIFHHKYIVCAQHELHRNDMFRTCRHIEESMHVTVILCEVVIIGKWNVANCFIDVTSTDLP
jgi:hypothetical protein